MLQKLHVNVLIVFLVIVGAFCRLYQIGNKTEFLGDQGSALTVIYSAVQQNQLPLTGPRTSLGYYPGPAYYYLLLPIALLTNYNPVAPAIMFALLGVGSGILLYAIGRKICSEEVGILAAALYLCSDTLISWNRRMWNPTGIPFFELLIIFLLLHPVIPKFWRLLLIGGLAAILLQLHLTTVMFVAAMVVLLGKEFFVKATSTPHQSIRFDVLLVLGSFCFVLLPYLYFEITNRFTNMLSFFRILISGNNTGSVADRLIDSVVPLPNWIAFALVMIMLVLTIRKKGTVPFWISVFMFVSIGLLMVFPQQLYLHYVIYLVPFVILNISWVMIELIPKTIMKNVLIGIVVILSGFAIVSQLINQGTGDIPRTQAVTKQMITMASGEPFSFTVSKTRSFSDYHYRFFLTIAHANVQPITDVSFRKMYVICESGDCPSEAEMKHQWGIQVLCFDHFCKPNYPEVKLDGVYDLRRSADIGTSRIYEFIRI